MQISFLAQTYSQKNESNLSPAVGLSIRWKYFANISRLEKREEADENVHDERYVISFTWSSSTYTYDVVEWKIRFEWEFF